LTIFEDNANKANSFENIRIWWKNEKIKLKITKMQKFETDEIAKPKILK
jgi:hypothetical protein